MEQNIHTRITESSIRTEEIPSLLNRPEHGAQIFFFGVVRNRNLGRAVITVSYDAFIPLVEVTFKQICEDANLKWGPGLQLVLIHRIGQLAIGEVSVAIGVGAVHRNEAFQASRFIIENIKSRAPIWKKEFYEDGETEWLDGHALCGHTSETLSEELS
ncbi:MAG: molybdenum cofactor biosynthesis protein MoaE [Bdellovibrionia bacterium]